MQSDLDFDAERALADRLPSPQTAGRTILRWIPVLFAVALLAQVGIRGLKPALAERRALQEKEAEVEGRFLDALDRRAELELRLEAQNDPIYHERMRRKARSAAEAER